MVASGSLRNDVFSVVLASNAVLLNGTTALVSGTFSCKEVSRASVFAVVTQDQGKTSVVGTGDLSGLSSTGASQLFSVPVAVVRPPHGVFRAGPASLVVDVSCGIGNQTLSTEVRLGK